MQRAQQKVHIKTCTYQQTVDMYKFHPKLSPLFRCHLKQAIRTACIFQIESECEMELEISKEQFSNFIEHFSNSFDTIISN